MGHVRGLALLVVAACGSFEEAPKSADGGAPASPADGGTQPTTPTELSQLYRCPRKEVPAKPFGKQSVIYTPARTPGEQLAPFGIATDTKSIYWIEQRSTDKDVYNGHGAGLLRRQAKGQQDTSEILVEDQSWAAQIALQGDWIYWGVSPDGGKSTIRRVRRDCTAPCDASVEDAVVVQEANGDVVKLVAAGTGSVFVQYRTGRVLEIDVTKAKPNATDRGSIGDLPSFAVAADAALVGTKGKAGVQQLDFGASGLAKPFGPLPVGVLWLVASCATVIAIMEGKNVWRSPTDGTSKGNFQLAGSLEQLNDIIFGAALDQNRLYLAVANAGGVFAYDAQVLGQPEKLYDGNVWFVTQDDDAIYWADHAREGGINLGKLYRQER